MSQLFIFLKKREKLFGIIMLLLILQSVGTLLIPYMIANLIDLGIMKMDMKVIISIGIQMVIVSLFTALVAIIGSYLSAEFTASFGKNLREAIFKKIQDLSISDFEMFGMSSLLTRTTTDISIIQKTLMSIFQMAIPTPFILITAIILTAKKSSILALIIIGFILIFIISTGIILKKSSKLSQYIQVHMDKINRILRESIIGVRVIRAFNQSQFEKERSNAACSEYALTMISLNKLFAFLNPVVWLVMGLVMASVIWFGSNSVFRGSMEIGGIISVIEYAVMALSYLIILATSIVMIPKAHNCLERINEVLNTKATIQDNEYQMISNSIEFPISLTFDKVNFSYQGAEENILDNISFSCEAGKTTAIIGSTGSGKSTIAKLILRLYDIQSGKILLNGKNIQEYKQYDLREKIGYIPQKAFLFSGTVQDNLIMGKKDASLQEMQHALEIAQAKTFIDILPEKLLTLVSQGGTNFSGGQKQRLAIARALIKDSEVYIFDDSFSALDFKTDAALRKALKENVLDSIIIIIAQRINTIIDADQIIVLDEGKIVGIGKHDELLNNCHIYKEIAKSQLDMEV